MGNRLSKIYTRTGDDGSSALADGGRVSKADPIFEVMGDVDELNSQLGAVRSQYQLLMADDRQSSTDLYQHLASLSDPDFDTMLQIIQHLLFNVGGELAMPEYQGVTEDHIRWLEHQIDTMNAQLPPLKDFILPTGSMLVCQLHITRSVCRRAERHAVTLRHHRPKAICTTTLSFINRLSDWLFVAARFCCAPSSRREVLWDAKVLQNLP